MPTELSRLAWDQQQEGMFYLSEKRNQITATEEMHSQSIHSCADVHFRSVISGIVKSKENLY
jgi:hypothetical protein